MPHWTLPRRRSMELGQRCLAPPCACPAIAEGEVAATPTTVVLAGKARSHGRRCMPCQRARTVVPLGLSRAKVYLAFRTCRSCVAAAAELHDSAALLVLLLEEVLVHCELRGARSHRRGRRAASTLRPVFSSPRSLRCGWTACGDAMGESGDTTSLSRLDRGGEDADLEYYNHVFSILLGPLPRALWRLSTQASRVSRYSNEERRSRANPQTAMSYEV